MAWQANYPETLVKAYVLNAPKIFELIWKVVRPVLADRGEAPIAHSLTLSLIIRVVDPIGSAHTHAHTPAHARALTHSPPPTLYTYGCVPCVTRLKHVLGGIDDVCCSFAHSGGQDSDRIR